MNTHLTYLNLLIASLIVSIPGAVICSSAACLPACCDPFSMGCCKFLYICQANWKVGQTFCWFNTRVPKRGWQQSRGLVSLSLRSVWPIHFGLPGGVGHKKTFAGPHKEAWSGVAPGAYCRGWVCSQPLLPSPRPTVHINKELYGKWPLTTNRKTEKVEKLFEKKKWNNKQHWQHSVGGQGQRTQAGTQSNGEQQVTTQWFTLMKLSCGANYLWTKRTHRNNKRFWTDRMGQDRAGQDIGHRRAGQENDKEAQTSVVIVLQLLYYNWGGLGTRNCGANL